MDKSLTTSNDQEKSVNQPPLSTEEVDGVAIQKLAGGDERMKTVTVSDADGNVLAHIQVCLSKTKSV